MATHEVLAPLGGYEQLSLDAERPNGAPKVDERPPPPPVTVAGRRLQPTVVFDTYWRFAVARQAIYEARVADRPAPWTSDPILRRHRFTNCYRASNRVSQFLIGSVIYRGAQEPEEIVFRTLLFKLFNRIATWRLLGDTLGRPAWQGFCLREYDKVLDHALSHGDRVYSAAYVIPPPRLGAERKHTNHLRLLEAMMHDDVTAKLLQAHRMQDAPPAGRQHPRRRG
jgi:hypothetical protein